MEIREHGPGGDHVRLTMPHFLFRSGLALASTRKLQRELDFHLDEGVAIGRLRDMWTELAGKPDGTEATRTFDRTDVTMRREGEMVVLKVSEPDWASEAPEAPEAPETPEEPEPSPSSGTATAHRGGVAPPPTAPAPAPPAAPKESAAPNPSPLSAEVSSGEPGETHDGGARIVTIRFPARFLEALTRSAGSLDIPALVDEMRQAKRGDVLEITSDDAQVRVWLD